MIIAAGIVRCFEQVFTSFFKHIGLLVVESQVNEALLQLIGIEPLHRIGDFAMQLLQAGAQLHVVSSFSQQGMAKHITQLIHRLPDLAFFGLLYLLLEQLGGIAIALDKLGLVFHHLRKHRQLKFPPDDRGCFYRLFDQERQTVDAGHQDGVDRAGQLDVFVADGPLPVLLFDQPAFHEVLDNLFEVERVAVGGAREQLEEFLVDGAVEEPFGESAHRSGAQVA